MQVEQVTSTHKPDCEAGAAHLIFTKQLDRNIQYVKGTQSTTFISYVLKEIFIFPSVTCKKIACQTSDFENVSSSSFLCLVGFYIYILILFVQTTAGMFTHGNSLCVLAFYLRNFWSSPPDLIVAFELLYPHSFSCPRLSSSPSSLYAFICFPCCLNLIPQPFVTNKNLKNGLFLSSYFCF